MSPFLVYLLFQADSIQGFFTIVAILAVIATGIFCFVGHMITDVGTYDEPERAEKFAKVRSVTFKLSCMTFFFGLGAAFLPSTKTIAAMIVLPKITSPQALDTMGKESRDIYELAKKALANLADDKPAASDKK
jgi:hypothetical protein